MKSLTQKMEDIRPIMTLIESHACYIQEQLKQSYFPDAEIESHFNLATLLMRLFGKLKTSQYTDGLADVAAIESLRPLFGNGLQGIRQILLNQPFARFQGRAVAAVECPGLGRKGVEFLLNHLGRLFAQGKTLSGSPDGGSEEILPLRRAVLLPHRLPGIDVPRSRN